MDTLIFILAALGVIVTLMTLSFIVGRASVWHDPYNFVQHKDDTAVNPITAKTAAMRHWQNYVTQMPTSEVRSIEHENTKTPTQSNRSIQKY